ncbi:MAG: hypothetical protein M5U09_00200 [Gammaproteobacteria bacterium]|nr:hypothetical protein [Gammaproteobacteria bacterium]
MPVAGLDVGRQTTSPMVRVQVDEGGEDQQDDACHGDDQFLQDFP